MGTVRQLEPQLALSTRKRNELNREVENPFASPLSSSGPAKNDAVNSFPRRAIWGSVLVMLPWPMLGIAACLGLSLFEELCEAVFLFGSVTMIFLLPLALVVDSMWIFGTFSVFVWLLVLLLPFCIGKKSSNPRFPFRTVLVCQAIFSAMQAGAGFLVVLGKYC